MNKTTPLTLRDVVSRIARRWRWLLPGMRVKRFLALLVLGTIMLLAGFVQFTWLGPLSGLWSWLVGQISQTAAPGQERWIPGLILALFGLLVMMASVVLLNRSILLMLGARPGEVFDRIVDKRNMQGSPRIVAIGGGTGLSNLLSGLKPYSDKLCAIVAVTDDGGSSGKLRRELGMPAPGDLTDCYAALSDSPILAKLLTHRFSRGEGIEGHTFGNLLLATLAEERGFAAGAGVMHEILNLRGQVIPATAETATLVAETEDGQMVRGEVALRERSGNTKIKKLRLDPTHPPAMPTALAAIMEADLIVVGPGSLYTSLIPPLLVPQLAKAVRESPAPFIYVLNVMTEHGETDNMDGLDHVRALSEHLGRTPNALLVNSTPISETTLRQYKLEQAEPIQVNNIMLEAWGVKVQAADLTSAGSGQHDPQKLASALMAWLRKSG